MVAQFNAENFVPRDRKSFALHEVAKLFQCDPKHCYELVMEGVLRVPQQEIERAKTHSTIRVSRKSLINFIRRRSSLEIIKRREEKASKREKTRKMLPKGESSSGSGLPFDVEDLIPRDRTSFSLRELAKAWWCSVQHCFHLVTEGELAVPQEEIDRAKSRSLIRVKRNAVVDFVRRRTGKAWFDQKRREKEAAKASGSSRKKRRRER
jgi:hypothetical protein